MSPAPRLRRLLVALLVGALLLALGALVPRWWQRVRGMPPWPVPVARLQAARRALPTLPVVTPRDLTDYRREFFGPAWTDVDGNGCDTRNDVLADWLQDRTHDPAKPCVVLSGNLADPYTGHLIHFERGPGTSRAIEIDHVVALADAWRKGAWQWSAAKALRFANDRANLIPVDGATNQQKGAADAAAWLPPNDGFHCAYGVVQILVKAAYGLGVDAAELQALQQILTGCEPARTAAHGPRCRWRPLPSLRCTRIPADTTAGVHRLEEFCHVRSGRHARLQRQRPDAGPGLRVRAAEPAGREARAPPAAADGRPDA